MFSSSFDVLGSIMKLTQSAALLQFCLQYSSLSENSVVGTFCCMTKLCAANCPGGELWKIQPRNSCGESVKVNCLDHFWKINKLNGMFNVCLWATIFLVGYLKVNQKYIIILRVLYWPINRRSVQMAVWNHLVLLQQILPSSLWKNTKGLVLEADSDAQH